MTKCRFCKHSLSHEMINMINAPPSNSYLGPDQLNGGEIFLPLKLFVCDRCFLVQLDEYKAAGEIFGANYAYFSSYSRSWLKHCENYVDLVTKRFSLSKTSKVVELASNDGYLLQFFKGRGIPHLGVEPTRGTAEAALKKGVRTVIRFFGEQCAKDLLPEEGKADLMVANNVLAHVPDINDFVKGIKTLLADGGVATAEFPHLLQLVKFNQFDTIYHEHYSYFSFTTIFQIFRENGLRIFDVEEIPTHGGSLRIYADHGSKHELTKSVENLLEREKSAGMTTLSFYSDFQEAADKIKYQFLSFLIEARTSKKRVAAYGAAAKGNTLLNYCGVKKDLIEFVVDASPHKQGKFLPGSHIPVVSEGRIKETKPDFVVILPWNLKSEITEQLSYIKDWGGKFVVAIPEVSFL